MTTWLNYPSLEASREPVRVLSLCTGIGGDTAAFELAGIAHETVAVGEFDPLASAVLQQKFPGVLNLGDITKIDNWKEYNGKIDIIIAGFPCQPYSAAGKQKGPDDPRDLSLEICGIVEAVQPTCFLFENVPGFETFEGGRPFAAFRKKLLGAGYAVDHRVLDASSFVAQRRARLFVCGYRGAAGTAPGEVLDIAGGGIGGAAPGAEKRIQAAAFFDGGASVLHPPRLGTIMASGSGMKGPGLTRHELDFLVVQKFPGAGLVVRRPTPLEGLRAQGFPDTWLDGIEYRGRPLTDNEKYRLTGNSWPVPVTASILSAIHRHWLTRA